jgi:hypothetical protein
VSHRRRRCSWRSCARWQRRQEHLTFLTPEFGRPFTADGLGNWFKKRFREAGVPATAHGLREAGATIAAGNRATEAELMAIFGWKSWKPAAHYT